MILKLLPLWGTPKRSPAGVPVTSPRTMTRSPDFLDVELHVGDGLGKASDHFDRGITAPAFAGQIAPARLVVRGEDFFLERLHIALDGLVEQAVPGGDHGARLCLGWTRCRGGRGGGQRSGRRDALDRH